MHFLHTLAYRIAYRLGYVLLTRGEAMNINQALDAAMNRNVSDKQALKDKDSQIANLNAQLAAATTNAPDPVKVKALVDSVLEADSATLP